MGQREGGRRRDAFLVLHLGRDWALGRPKHHPRTLSSLPKPVTSRCHHQRQVRLVLLPLPPPSVSPELWVVQGLSWRL